MASNFRLQLIVATLTRLVMNTALRMTYPFLPEISRGLGVPLQTLAYSLSLRGALGMAAPIFGVLPDRLSRRNAILVGVVLFSAAVFAVGLFPSFWTFTASVLVIVVAKFIFDPALQAYLADRTPYSRRGLVIGLAEIGWSGAALVGIPLAGYLIARGTWRSPYLPIGGITLAAGLFLWFIMPRQSAPKRAADVPPIKPWRLILRPAIVAALSIGLFTSMGNELLNVVYGSWMEQAFSLPIAGLGLSTTVIGLAELAGEGLVMAFTDRLGKRRAIAYGLGASALAYCALPWLAQSLTLALVGLFLVFIAFEFTIVSTLPLMTELVPEARSTVISTEYAFHSAGRMLGALGGAYLFQLGFAWTGLSAALLNLIALAAVIWLVRERQPEPV